MDDELDKILGEFGSIKKPMPTERYRRDVKPKPDFKSMNVPVILKNINMKYNKDITHIKRNEFTRSVFTQFMRTQSLSIEQIKVLMDIDQQHKEYLNRKKETEYELDRIVELEKMDIDQQTKKDFFQEQMKSYELDKYVESVDSDWKF